MKINKPSLALIFCFSALLVIEGCVSHDLAEVDPPFVVTCTPDDEELSYSTDIVPIIDANCAIPTCHGDDPNLPDWTQHDELASHTDEIMTRITLPLSDPGSMPAKGELTDDERHKLYCWLENGALNN
jgi:hypothetical protein